MDEITHEEHLVMLQDLSKTHSTKVALNIWVFGKEAVSQLVDVEQYPVPSNSVVLTSAQQSYLSHLHSSIPQLGHVLHHDRGVRFLLRLEWKGRRKKGISLHWGNRYGPAHKCPDGKKQGRTNDSLPKEEMLHNQQSETLKANFKKYELIDGVQTDGTLKHLAARYGTQLDDY
ncbi:hypothetical protein E3N88_12462 [Mikania micrantha]|uniref:Uncharacterized protein n=1 Tax=Mikania micrantha TaxID=192012 RepID=A0A5N6P5Y3_9ASTR|nr:hypothetical protein E3N88_12462 [Mikania micrantha]